MVILCLYGRWFESDSYAVGDGILTYPCDVKAVRRITTTQIQDRVGIPMLSLYVSRRSRTKLYLYASQIPRRLVPIDRTRSRRQM